VLADDHAVSLGVLTFAPRAQEPCLHGSSRWKRTEAGPMAALDRLSMARALAAAALDRLSMARALAAAVLGGGVAAVAFWRRALTLDGAVAASVVGALVFFKGGLPAAASLLAFFGGSSALSRLGASRKGSGPLAQA